ncbi:PREDICTED: homeobox protein ESX1-like [Galeopterus variegatus]|uniref:Homeobox protein ESX1-like n=1 Tax=Galeopterus variegatus TaxID=482537 RepID=A0ABM0RII3_GALVR|nr:PREDICTED: homeobox protein ESX1-like [Galeopterus variegatus]
MAQALSAISTAALRFAQPRERQLQVHRTRFTVLQWQELESIFWRNQYPDVPTRNELARRMHVPEARVKRWFRNRRARWRRQQRTLMLRNMPPVIQGPPVFIIWRASYNALLVREPYWRQVFLLPPPPPLLGLPLLPVQPMPYVFLPFVPLPLPYLHPAGPGFPVLVWCLIIINPVLYPIF